VSDQLRHPVEARVGQLSVRGIVPPRRSPAGETGEVVGYVDLAALHRVADDWSEVGGRALPPDGLIGERVSKERIIVKGPSEHPRRGLNLVPAKRPHAR
jgi:hypothetical protein